MNAAMDGGDAGAPITEAERAEALRELKRRRDFGAHVVSFVVVNAALWIIWALTGHGYPWPLWITGLWAIGVVFNAWDVYGRRRVTEADVRREVERTRRGG